MSCVVCWRDNWGVTLKAEVAAVVEFGAHCSLNVPSFSRDTALSPLFTPSLDSITVLGNFKTVSFMST